MSNNDVTEKEDGANSSVQLDNLEPLREAPFTAALDELEQLLSQRRRAFLLGAGCSKCAGLPVMDGLTTQVFNRIEPDTVSREILDVLVGQFQGANRPNIEDYLSELVDLMAIAERRSHRKATINTVPLGEKMYEYENLLSAYSTIKKTIRACIQEPSLDMEHHRRFVRALHATLRSGKTGPKSTVDYFMLNYDTLVEDALALEQVKFADGFEGGATGWWSPETFAEEGLEARVLKLHGGIDWRLLKGDTLPRRIRESLSVSGDQDPVLIWPAATKYRETQRDPYAQVLDVLRRCLKPGENTEIVLAIIGYAFGDSHINVELENALRESRDRLTCVVFSEDECPSGELGRWFKDANIRQQIRVYSRRGFFHGDDVRLSEANLPWWKFEVLARLLGGER